MENTVPKLSIVSPVYQSEATLELLVSEVEKVMKSMQVSYEIILVDDRSKDNSWSILQSISKKNIEVTAVRLSRNFGQHPAIMAGLSISKGDWVVVLDCDLQDQPKEIVKLYEKAMEGYDVVLAKRVDRQDSFFKKTSSYIFSKSYKIFTDTHYDHEIANFGIYKKKVISSILEISDYIKFFPLFVKFVGFNVTSLEVDHANREEGKSSYSYSKLISLAFNTIISFSNKPLKLFVKFGLLVSILSFLVGVYYMILAFTGKIEVLGFSSIIISIWFLSGVIITTIGVCGIYLGKIFDQTKNRPVYIIDEIV
ncbi:dolichol-phosphate mannosyltransferase [Gillisia sp. Hel1_33_143]|uniref:glycosyltransferase family 2 protein n=1 Tax=Gillisia sp. Hel1_33_143 TaxID=1336796 RepID=UPI00087A1B7C|nr:glycosyltransferase family 2 protein [Gillisia sp. Hel1_33_143]SDS24112.1 dolichol-phosphate mannosyltransferase [Gillisia sp. Hel1_33_143]